MTKPRKPHKTQKQQQPQVSKKRLMFQAWFVMAWAVLIPLKMIKMEGVDANIGRLMLAGFEVFLIYQFIRLIKKANLAKDE